jgi:uncharacterized protein
MITRRALLKTAMALGVSTAALTTYALAETFGHKVTRYRLSPPNWPAGLKLRIAVLTDLHACDPWMSIARIDRIVRQCNGLGADIIVLLGDYVAGHRLARLSQQVPFGGWAMALSALSAPLGVHAVLGNHDWWHDRAVQDRRAGPVAAGLALEAAGIPVYENKAVRIAKGDHAFWLAGLGDQWAFWPRPDDYDRFVEGGKRDYTGVDDLPGTLAQVNDDAPVILLAHEPDIFPNVPDRVAVTLSGHTHGGQVRLFGYAPIVPSRFGDRYVYGHIVEDGRNLIVSAGLGCSVLPVRLGAAPEIVVVNLGLGDGV